MSVKANRIELDKTRGLTVEVRNGENTQTISLDGETITITVAGPGGTSTIEQTPTTVTVTADNFIVNARTITETGSLAATMQSGESRVALNSEAAELLSPAISLTASAKLNAIAPKMIVCGTTATALTAPEGELLIDGGSVNIGAPLINLKGAVNYE